MKTKTYAICQHCSQPIINQDGLIIQGNIYMIDANDIDARGGIIGNNFPDKENFCQVQIEEVSWHWECLYNYINKHTTDEQIRKEDEDED